MSDTVRIVKVVHDTIIKTIDTQKLDVIDKVNNFYDSAWTKLIIIGSIVGVIIPILFALYQRKLYSLSKKELVEEMSKEISEIKTQLSNSIQAEVNSQISTIDSKFENLERNFNNKLAAIDAGTFHVQGNNHLRLNDYTQALMDFTFASYKYLIGEDYTNFSIVIKTLYETCIPQFKYSDIEKHLGAQSITLDDLIKRIEEKNEKGIFSIHLSSLRLAINESKLKI